MRQLRNLKNLHGFKLKDRDGEIGHVEDFVLDGKTWAIRYQGIDTGKWLPGRKTLLPPAWLRNVGLARNEISIDLPSDLIKTAPEYDPATLITRDYQLALCKHYEKAFDSE